MQTLPSSYPSPEVMFIFGGAPSQVCILKHFIYTGQQIPHLKVIREVEFKWVQTITRENLNQVAIAGQVDHMIDSQPHQLNPYGRKIDNLFTVALISILEIWFCILSFPVFFYMSHALYTIVPWSMIDGKYGDKKSVYCSLNTSYTEKGNIFLTNVC